MATKQRPSPSKSKKAVVKKPRRLKPAKYRSLRISKRIKHPIKLPSVWSLSKSTVQLLWRHKGLFVGITVIYGLLNLALVQGFSGGVNVSALKQNIDLLTGASVNSFDVSFTIFQLLVGSAGKAKNAASGYQLVLLLMVSLACIWALRQVLARTKVRVRDAYYRGMYPFVPFVIVLLVIAVQLLPLLIGAIIYSAVTGFDIAVYPLEKFVWGLLYALLALLSLYLITSSVFALYIVTLPDMTPLKALRSARGLVRNRRWTVLRKILVLPVILLIIAAVIMVPVIIVAAVLSQWVFYFLTMIGIAAVHAYMYLLYRELLRD